MLHTLKERLGQKRCYDHFYRPSWKTAFDTGRRRLWGRHTAKFVKREDVSRLGRRGEGIELDEEFLRPENQITWRSVTSFESSFGYSS